MKISVGSVYLHACPLGPFMMSNEFLSQLNLPPEGRRYVIRGREEKLQRQKVLGIGKPASLFEELKDDEADAHRNKYPGSQTERSSKLTADEEANKVAKGSKVSGGVPKKRTKETSYCFKNEDGRCFNCKVGYSGGAYKKSRETSRC